MKRKQRINKFITIIVITVRVLASLSAAATAIIQPPALTPLLGTPKAALADANPGGTTTSQITGTVFQDFNSNGVMNTIGTSPNVAIDIGVSGVTVSAYVSAFTPGASVATAMTNTYLLGHLCGGMATSRMSSARTA